MTPLAAMAMSIALHFEPNVGQAAGGVRWTAAANGYSLLLSDTSVKMRLTDRVEIGLSLPNRRPEGLDVLPGKSNYYFGSQAQVGVPHYARVRYRSVYPGIDLEVYGKGQAIEYDWIVAPGADPGSIRMRFTGARPRVDRAGDLVFDTSAGQMRHRKSRVVQGEREVPGEFVVGSEGEVGFRLGDYDRTKTLVIDPQIVWATGFGGSGFGVNFVGVHGKASDVGTGIAVDSSGNTYITGTTFSTDFPVVSPVVGPPACVAAGCVFRGMFVSKLSADGKTLLYSTYFGTKLLSTNLAIPAALPAAIAVDGSGNAYVTGTSDATNPLSSGLPMGGGMDAFLLRLGPKGELGGLRFYGGSGDDAGTALQFAADGTLYLAGTTKSADLYTSTGAYRAKLSSAQDVFVMRLELKQFVTPQVMMSTYLGPGDTAALAIDNSGNAYVAASTTSAGWNTTPGVLQPKCGGSTCADVVVAKVDPTGSKLLYATYLGGSDVETLGGLAVDAAGSAYISGSTFSSDFPTPTFAPGFPGRKAGQADGSVFAVKLSPDASSLVYSFNVSGRGTGQGNAIAVDAAGDAYVAGSTTSTDFSVADAVQTTLYNSVCAVYTPSGSVPSGQVPCASAGFLSEVVPAGNGVFWSTYLGSGSVQAVTLDSAGDVFVTGQSIAFRGGTVGVVKIAPGGEPLTFFADRAITDGASFMPGLPRPGGLASMFLMGGVVTGVETATSYPLPIERAGVALRVDGVPAPILSVTAPPTGTGDPLAQQQVNFQVPFEAKSNVVEVRYKGLSTFLIPPQVEPGLFGFLDGSGAIQHGSDYSLVTSAHPAKKGEVVIFYLTGLGLVDPLPVTGSAAMGAAPMKVQCSPPFMNVGDILYAGITPGFAGLYQLNVRLSDTLPSGINNAQLRWSDCWLGAPPENFYLSNTVGLAVE
jgi:uncharacterized protein (TIGR03437 family)